MSFQTPTVAIINNKKVKYLKHVGEEKLKKKVSTKIVSF